LILGSSPNSSSHFLATLGAASASVHAFFHFTDSLTICGALITDFAAQATSAFVKFRSDQHEMSGCPANLGASHHQAEVLGLGMFTASLQTLPHRRR
jgi:hypothetical protein